MALPSVGSECHDLQCILTPAVGSFLEIAFSTSHLVGHVRKANYRFLSCLRERVKCCSFHLDGHDTQLPAVGNGGRGLSEWGIRRPRPTAVHCNGCVQKHIAQHRHEFWRKVAEVCRWKIVIACPLIPAEVTLMTNSQPDANNSSATRTANDAPTAQPIIPKRVPSCVNAYRSV